ncbi:MAG: DUF3109 family protein [Bacteroidota bacterium]
MPDKESIQLRKHHLRHIPALRVHPSFFGEQFASGCSMYNCNADCCHYGVMVDLQERDLILRHTELIQRYMEPQQEHDSSRWFEKEEQDLDFPSGKAVGTQARDYGCVFLDSGGKCVLQKAAVGEGMHKFALKPFYCVAYPLTIEHGELIIDDADFVSRPACCSVVKEGVRTIFDVCSEELEHVLGKDGFAEIQEAAGSQK